MNDLPDLHALGLELPSPGYLVGAVLFGLIGLVAWRHGRRQARPAVTWAGAALMFYPYVVSQAWLLWLVGAALCAWTWTRWND